MTYDNGPPTVTVIPAATAATAPPLRVTFPGVDGTSVTKIFTSRFTIGRSSECEVHLIDEGISRKHVEIGYDGTDWWIKDLGSINGTYVDDRPIDHTRMRDDAQIDFFAGGPIVRLQVDFSRPHVSVADNQVQKAARPKDRADTTDNRVQRKKNASLNSPHRLHLRIAMTTLALLLAVAISVIFYQQGSREKELALTERLFYETKALEIELARLKRNFSGQGSSGVPATVKEADSRLRAMQREYTDVTQEMELIGSHRSHDDLLIFRVARIFGEYHLSIPDDFVSEVKRYISVWQTSQRLPNAIARITEDQRATVIADALRDRGLPPQFLYLALQESNFNTKAIGPNTRYGVAKGMWQFIPGTAKRYGLSVGPQKNQRVYDAQDERFDFEKSTKAAADYLNFLFTTEAQASGLLVMSAYNWGEGNVARTLARLPNDPTKHNFWHLIKSQMIPDETYGYVLNIYAAAVICEDPAYFGFSFENPLAAM